MLSTYFQTQTSIVSFQLTSNHLGGLMLWSAQQGKIKLIKKKCCSAADVISAELGSACVYLSLLHESSRQSHSTVPVPTKAYCSFPKLHSSQQPYLQAAARHRNASSGLLSGEEWERMPGSGWGAGSSAATHAQHPPPAADCTGLGLLQRLLHGFLT